LREGSSSFQANIFPLVGTIPKAEQITLKKMIFRASRGNAFTLFFDIKDKIHNENGEEEDNCVYFIIFPE